MRPRKDARNAKIISAYKKGASTKVLADEFGLHFTTVDAILAPTRRAQRKALVEKIEVLRAQGLTWGQVGVKLKMHPDTARKTIKK